MAPRLEGGLAARDDRPLGSACPIDRALGLVGNRTSMLLLREVYYGGSRFDELVRRTGMTQAAAAGRLRELVDAGVLAKQPYREPGSRTRQEYVLTDSGTDLVPAMIALLEWGAAHTTRPGARSAPTGRVTASCADCGEAVHVTLACDSGHVLEPDDLVITTPPWR